MKQVLTRVLLAVMVGAGALSIAPVAAMADGIYFGFDTGPDYRRGPPPPPPPGRFYGEPNVYERRAPPPPGYGCSPRQAIRQAWRMGFQDPEVVRVTPRRVVVEGEIGRRLRQVQFANVPGCPPL